MPDQQRKGRPDGSPDPSGPKYSQPYISAVATRAIIYTEADNFKIGLMAIVFIGMAEVSSCEFVVREGRTIREGQQISLFHFGRSSRCMLFRKGSSSSDLQRHGTWTLRNILPSTRRSSELCRPVGMQKKKKTPHNTCTRICLYDAMYRAQIPSCPGGDYLPYPGDQHGQTDRRKRADST